MMPTKREVIAELRKRAAWLRKYAYVPHEVRCLEVALLCVQKTKWPRKRK